MIDLRADLRLEYQGYAYRLQGNGGRDGLRLLIPGVAAARELALLLLSHRRMIQGLAPYLEYLRGPLLVEIEGMPMLSAGLSAGDLPRRLSRYLWKTDG